MAGLIQDGGGGYTRKRFLLDTSTLMAGTALAPLTFGKMHAGNNQPAPLTIQEVIDRVIAACPTGKISNTVDTIKSGNPSQPVAGIVTTMFPTVDIIQKTAALGANFIIAHEPSFYNHSDNLNWVSNNAVAEKKLALLKEKDITVWRFHDYAHAMKPDLIRYGVALEAGWLSQFRANEVVLEIPPLDLDQLAHHLKKSLKTGMIRVMGNPAKKCRRIALLPGAWGGARQVTTALLEKPDVLVVGETTEWETVEFIRDGLALGFDTALIVLGHSVSEEPGMAWTKSWLEKLVPGISVTHLPSGDPFTRYV